MVKQDYVKAPYVDDNCLLMYFPIKLFSYVVDVT